MKYSFKVIVALFVILYAVITLLFFNFYRELAMKDAKQEAIFILDTMNAIDLKLWRCRWYVLAFIG